MYLSRFLNSLRVVLNTLMAHSGGITLSSVALLKEKDKYITKLTLHIFTSKCMGLGFYTLPHTAIFNIRKDLIFYHI